MSRRGMSEMRKGGQELNHHRPDCVFEIVSHRGMSLVCVSVSVRVCVRVYVCACLCMLLRGLKPLTQIPHK